MNTELSAFGVGVVPMELLCHAPLLADGDLDIWRHDAVDMNGLEWGLGADVDGVGRSDRPHGWFWSGDELYMVLDFTEAQALAYGLFDGCAAQGFNGVIFNLSAVRTRSPKPKTRRGRRT